jgi:hypothetical protein
MSLDVSPELLDKAQHSEIDDASFVDCIRTSLPYAWEMISNLVARLHVDGGEFADNQTPPPTSKPAASSSASSPATPCAAPSNATSASSSPSRTATA